MAIVFPASPSVNETFTEGSITYKWDGDKWIGLGVTPADRLVEGSNSLEINASNNLVWTGNNVGIGIDNPGALLHLESTASNAAKLRIGFDSPRYYDIFRGSTTNSGYLNFYGSQSTFVGYIFDGVDGERLRITSGGDVGIGEDSPADRLVVQKTNASGDVGVRIKNDTLTDGDSTNPTTASLYLNTSTGDFNTFYIQARRSDNNTHFGYSNPRDANHTPNLVITSNGTILAGGQTSSYDGGFVNLELRNDSTTVGGSMTLVNDQSATAGATCQIDCYQNFRAAGKIVFGRENGNNWQSAASGAYSFLAFHTNNAGTEAEKLRITATGRIQQLNNNEDIDMDAAASGQLQLDGNGYTAGFALNAQGLNIYHNSASRAIIFGINETERIRITPDGNLKFSTAGTGIDFSANANAAGMTSEVLDDYEEGSWVPTTVSFDGSLTINSAFYIKVGTLCFVQAYVSFSNTDDSSSIVLAGLPFVGAGQNNQYCLMNTHTNGGLDELHLRAQGTNDRLTAVHLSSGNGDVKPTYTSLKDKFLIFSGCYTTV